MTTVVGAGVDGSDRVFIEFADGAITNGWLQVTVLANASTGLTNDEVFYFGNVIGESGNDPTSAIVNLSDISSARTNQTGFGATDVLNAFDFNRDAVVNLADISIARTNQSGFTPVNLITPTNSNEAAGSKLPSSAESTADASVFAAPVSIAAVNEVRTVDEVPIAIKQFVESVLPNRTDSAASLPSQIYVTETIYDAGEADLDELEQGNDIARSVSLELADSVAARLADHPIVDFEFAAATATPISSKDAQLLDDVFAGVFDAD